MKRIVSCVLLVLLVVGHGKTYARLQGKAKLDSFLFCLPQQKEDSHKVRMLLAISENYYPISDDSAFRYTQMGVDLAAKLNWKLGMGMGLTQLGNRYQAKGDSVKAIDNFQKAQKILLAIADRKRLAVVNLSLGSFYLDFANFPLALENFDKAIHLFEELGDKMGIAVCSQNAADACRAQSNYPRGLEYALRALKTFEEIGDKDGIAGSLIVSGEIYYFQKDFAKALENYTRAMKISEDIGSKRYIVGSANCIGNYYSDRGEAVSALEYFKKGLKIAEEMGDIRSIIVFTSCMGNAYTTMRNFELALRYFQQSLQGSEEIGDPMGTALTLGNMGEVYLLMIDSSHIPASRPLSGANRDLFNKGISYLERSMKISKEIGDLGNIQNNYQRFTQAYKLVGNYKLALENEEQARIIKDSIFSQENTKKIVQQGMKYEFEKKEALAKAEQDKKNALAAKELQKQKLVRNGFIGGFAIVLLFAGTFFTQRNKIKAGKKQSDELLLNILPAEVAEELKAKGSADAKLIEQVTVLFTDFKGFTQLSEKLSPKELVAEINDCFSAFDHIMHKYGVEKIKTIGDAYMAAGGLPTPNNTHAADVVKAAIDIQEYMQQHKLKKEAAGQLFFEIRIGVHTGPVVAGIVGIKKFQYDIWGDTVNTASRMESSGEIGKVNISGTTYELVKNKFACTYRGKIAAKGKGDIDMYFVS